MTKEALNVAVDAPGLEAALEMEDRNQVLRMLEMKCRDGSGPSRAG